MDLCSLVRDSLEIAFKIWKRRICSHIEGDFDVKGFQMTYGK